MTGSRTTGSGARGVTLGVTMPNKVGSLVGPISRTVHVLGGPGTSEVHVLILAEAMGSTLGVERDINRVKFLGMKGAKHFSKVSISRGLILAPAVVLAGTRRRTLGRLITLSPGAYVRRMPGSRRGLIGSVLSGLS